MADQGYTYQQGNLDKYLTDTLISAPELGNAPGLAVPSAQQSAQMGGNTKQNAHVVAHVANMSGHNAAQADVKQQHGNLFTHALGWITKHLQGTQQVSGTPTIQGARVAENKAIQSGVASPKPLVAALGNGVNLGQSLREVQHQYRTIRDVYQTEGVAAGLAATAVVAAGAAAGTIAGPEGTAAGGIIGGELVGGIADRTVFQKSWQNTMNGDAYLDGAGQQVSPGRDIARLGSHIPFIGHYLREGSLGQTALSAVGDGLFDLTADPAAAAAGVAHGVLSGDDAILHGPESVDDLVTNHPAQTQRVFGDIANKNAVEIYNSYPQFRSIALDLGDASSVDDVADTFRDALQGPELRTSRVPYLRTGGAPTGTDPSAFDVTAGADDPISRLQGLQRRATSKIPMILTKNLDFSNTLLDPTSAEAPAAFRQFLEFSKLSDRTIDAMQNDFIHEPNGGMRRLMFANAKVRMAMSMGMEDSTVGQEVLSRLRQDVTDLQGGTGGAEGNHFGYAMDGHDLSRMPGIDGSGTTGAINVNQRGPMEVPQYRSWLRVVRETQGAKALFGRLDDWGNRIITPFKQVALLTGGFAARVATAEAIPAVFRNGVSDTLDAALAAKIPDAAAHGVSLDELEDMKASAIAQMHGPKSFIVDPKLVDRAFDLQYANGAILPPAFGTDDYASGYHVGKIEADRLNMDKAIQSSPTRLVESGEFGGFMSGDNKFPLMWQRAIREAGTDEGMRLHAAAYCDAYINAMREQVPIDRAGGFIDVASRAVSDEPAALLPGDTATGEPTSTAIEPATTGPQGTTGTRTRTPDEAIKLATREAIKVDEDWLRNGLDPKILSDLKRSVTSATEDDDPIRSFARVRVEATKGLTHTPLDVASGRVSPEPHLNILDDIANGKTTDIDTLKDVKGADRPLTVKGRMAKPSVAGNIIDRIANIGWKRVFDPIIATVGREHQYLLTFDKYMDDLDGLVESGQLSKDDAIQSAQVKSIKDMARFIHNPYERTQFSELSRAVAPFYFAQEQSYRRAGRLLMDDPAAFRRYQIVSNAFTNMVHTQQDENGNTYAVIPGLGWLDEIASQGLGIAGITPSTASPIQVLGNTSSLSTLFPLSDNGVRPSFSPFITVPAHILTALLPEARPQISGAIGGAAASGSVWDQLIPSTPLRNLVHAFSGSTDDQTIASGAAQTFVALAYRQQVAMTKWLAAGHSADDPGAPDIVPPPNASSIDKKKFIERVRNQSRINQIFRAIVSAVSPLSPKIAVGDYGIKQEIQTYIDKYGVSDGLERYLAKNPDATPYTISMSSTADDAPAVNPTKAAQSFVNANLALFKKFPAAAGYLIPQDTTGKFDSAVYQEQIALGLRDRKGIGDIENDFYVNEGFGQYNTDYAAHQAAVAQAGDDTDAVKAENGNWNDYLTNVLGAQNPVWWDYFTSQDRNNRRVREVAQLRQMATDPATPQNVMTRGIQGLLADLDAHEETLSNGSLDGWSKADRQTEVDNWEAYLQQMQQQHPELAIVISRLFSHEGAK